MSGPARVDVLDHALVVRRPDLEVSRGACRRCAGAGTSAPGAGPSRRRRPARSRAGRPTARRPRTARQAPRSSRRRSCGAGSRRRAPWPPAERRSRRSRRGRRPPARTAARLLARLVETCALTYITRRGGPPAPTQPVILRSSSAGRPRSIGMSKMRARSGASATGGSRQKRGSSKPTCVVAAIPPQPLSAVHSPACAKVPRPYAVRAMPAVAIDARDAFIEPLRGLGPLRQGAHRPSAARSGDARLRDRAASAPRSGSSR